MKLLYPLLWSLIFALNSKADIVYTTSNTAGTQSNSNVPAQPSAQTDGFVIGKFTNATTFNFSTDKAVVRFTTGSSPNLNYFTGIRWNSFLDDHAGSTGSGLISGSFLWTLYNNQNGSTSLFSQNVNPVIHPNTGSYSPNVYQDGAWNLLAGTNVLDASTTYTLALTGLNLGGTTGNMNQDELHWTYYTSTAAGGTYNVLQTGTMTTPSGTGAITAISPLAPGIGLAYDLNATVVPEPRSILFSSFMAIFCVIANFLKKLFI